MIVGYDCSVVSQSCRVARSAPSGTGSRWFVLAWWSTPESAVLVSKSVNFLTPSVATCEVAAYDRRLAFRLVAAPELGRRVGSLPLDVLLPRASLVAPLNVSMVSPCGRTA